MRPPAATVAGSRGGPAPARHAGPRGDEGARGAGPAAPARPPAAAVLEPAAVLAALGLCFECEHLPYLAFGPCCRWEGRL